MSQKPSYRARKVCLRNSTTEKMHPLQYFMIPFHHFSVYNILCYFNFISGVFILLLNSSIICLQSSVIKVSSSKKRPLLCTVYIRYKKVEYFQMEFIHIFTGYEIAAHKLDLIMIFICHPPPFSCAERYCLSKMPLI